MIAFSAPGALRAAHLRRKFARWLPTLGPGEIALTFDDGPYPGVTSSILDSLNSHGAAATFFMVGREVARDPGLARAAAQGGHAVQGHGHDHLDFTTADDSTLMREIDRAHDILASVTGRPVTRLRPPYASFDDRVIAQVKRRNLQMVLWDLDALDWRYPLGRRRADRLVGLARPGSVILLHQTPQTAACLDRLLEGLVAKGLRFACLN